MNVCMILAYYSLELCILYIFMYFMRNILSPFGTCRARVTPRGWGRSPLGFTPSLLPVLGKIRTVPEA